MPLDFPASPSVGQAYGNWQWNGTAWVSIPTTSNDVINVGDYGAVADGVTDCSSAINTALATLRDVFFPTGIYRVAHAINVPVPGAHGQRIYSSGGAVISVGAEFDPGALGVFVYATSKPRNTPGTTLDSIEIRFDQPQDIVTTATASASSGATSITVASASGVVAGMYVVDATRHGLSTRRFDNGPPVTVASVAGNTINLNGVVAAAGVQSGDSIQFGSARSQFRALGSGGTTTTGGTSIQYPWAIYANVVDCCTFRNVWITGAYNGFFFRGSTPTMDAIYVGALNLGYDIDQCFNFGWMGELNFQAYGFSGGGANPINAALMENYYDGTVTGFNIGELDGGYIANISCLVGIVNITSAWTWGTIGAMSLDTNFSNLNILSAYAGLSGWLTINALYTTKGNNNGIPVVHSPTSANFVTTFNYFRLLSSTNNQPGVQITGGRLQIFSGMLDNGSNAGPAFNLLGGSLKLCDFDASGTGVGPSGAAGWISQTGGTLYVDGLRFLTAPTGGWPAIYVTDNAANVVRNVTLTNGWSLVNIPTTSPLGYYQNHVTVTAPVVSTPQITSNTGTLLLPNVIDTTSGGHLAIDPYVDIYGNVTVGFNTAGAPALTLNGTAAAGKLVYFETAGTVDWIVGEDTTTGDFSVHRYSGGTPQGTPFVIRTASGQVEIGSRPTDVLIGKQSAGSTADTTGHLFVPFSAGTPSAVPTNAAKGVALRYDTTGHKLWAYDNSSNAWVGVVTIGPADITAAGGALLASPVFTGTPAAPTATAGTNTTQLATTAFVTTATGAYLPIAGGTITPGGLTVAAGLSAASAKFQIDTNGISYSGSATNAGGYVLNGPTASARTITFQTAGTQRWVLQADSSAEGGSNAGTNFVLTRLDDTGTSLGNPLTINRATGVMTVANGATITNGGLAINGGGMTVTGATTFNQAVTASGGMTVTGAATLNNTVTFAGSNAMQVNGSMTLNVSGPTIRSGAGAASGTQPNGSLWIRNDGTTGARLYVSAGGGTWAAVAGV